MILKPYKRVGEPASFKGIKGPYLFLSLYYTGGLMCVLFLIFIIPMPQIILLSSLIISIGYWLIKISSFKKKSKDGDINIITKNSCRKNLTIKGNPYKTNEKINRKR